MGFRPVKSNATSDADEPVASATLRAFSLLECIARAPRSPTLEELTRVSGLPKPTVYRILQLLMRGDLVERELYGKRYTVGTRSAAIAFAVQMHGPRRAERLAILSRLVSTIGETCNFTMLDGAKAVYLERVETSASVRLQMKAGSRVPLHCTASGKLLLSDLSTDQVHRLVGPTPLRRYTQRTITDIDVLLRELAKIRSSGVGTDVGEYLEGSVCLAVPVCDARGRTCATVAVHGPAPRMSLKKGFTFLPAMRDAATAIGRMLVPGQSGPASVPEATVPKPRRIAA